MIASEKMSQNKIIFGQSKKCNLFLEIFFYHIILENNFIS